MKKQPYHSPTRKSPRLSSSAPRNAKPESGTRPEDAWSLTVHVVEHQPLRICFPSTETVAPLRRSSRYTTNKYSSPPPERSRSKNRSQKALALVSSQLRRSPRFCSAPPLTLTSGENAGSKQSRRVAEAEESGRVRKRVKLICNGEPPRRSTRLSGGENGNSLLALPETGERSFRLRAKAESQKTKIKRTFDELSAKQKCSSIIKCDLVESAGKRKSNREVRESPKLDLLPFAESGKCLRSRIVKTQLQEERVERDVAVINGDDKCLKTPTKKLTFDRFTHVYEKKGKTINICFIGQPIPEEEAQKRWQWRYDLKSSKKGKGWKLNENEEDEIILNVHCHYAQAKLGNVVLNLGDCVHVKGEGKKKHVGRILEFFKTTDGEDYFRVQWFFMAEDTVLKDAAASHDKRRLFSSVLMNDNILDCIISKVNVVQVPATLNSNTKPAQSAAYYYDMEYCVDYSTFRTLVTESSVDTQTLLLDTKPHEDNPITSTPLEVLPKYDSLKQELALLDLYSGCGGMSTGLCFGAKLASVNLITKWAVDYNSSACESLKLNHPETQE